MRETVRSLRIYFIFIGLSALWQIAGPAMRDELHGVSWAYLAPAIGLALVYLGMGIWLKPLLAKQPQLIIKVLYGSLAAEVVGFVLMILSGNQRVIINLVIALAITGYLVVNVRRLSQAPA